MRTDSISFIKWIMPIKKDSYGNDMWLVYYGTKLSVACDVKYEEYAVLSLNRKAGTNYQAHLDACYYKPGITPELVNGVYAGLVVKEYVAGHHYLEDFKKPGIRTRFKVGQTNLKRQYMDSSTTTPELSFGQKAAGVTFNPGNNPLVDTIKSKFASIIDEIDQLRKSTESGEAKRYCSKAISYAEDAQMNAVKAATWQY